MTPRPDVLGDGWLARDIPLRATEAYGPAPRAVLVNHVTGTPDDTGRDAPAEWAVLYLHGFTDYFFQAEHAARWVGSGFAFYALDMRLSGRALGDHPRPGDVRDLRHHDEEIGAALDHLAAAGHRKIIMLAHSTGGLIACSWAARHPGRIAGLILNSPWLDHHGPWYERHLLTPVVGLLARWLPSVVVGRLGSEYGQWLHRSTGGEWEYDLAWKPQAGFPVRAAFFSSVRREHAAVARGLGIDVPILLCCSTASAASAKRPTPAEMARTDVVLSIADMVHLAPRLGDRVTVAQIPDGVHDLALSAPPAREAYERTVLGWASGLARSGDSGAGV